MSALVLEPLPSAPPPRPIAPLPAPSPAPPYQGFGAEKRREPRYSTCDAAEVSLLDLPGAHFGAVVHDVSKNGLRIELDLPVTSGSRLKITLRKRAIVFAIARYCRRTGNTYHVGAEIESAYYPSRTSTSLVPLDTSDSQPEPGQVARSIIHHHSSFIAGNPDQFRDRLAPFSDEPI
ncbi:MAG TPA: PilZ domain-containing protein [Bryobacteraceae bacterium]|nr:PilZ domain-containing protein [Bryobacteraceae bacterium]